MNCRGRARRALLAAAGCAVMGVVLLAQIPAVQLWAADVINFAHGPAFGMVALLTLAFVRETSDPRRTVLREYAVVLVITATFGAAIEILQSVIGGDASWGDLARDVLGASTALGMFASIDSRTRVLPNAESWRVTAFVAGLAGLAALLGPLAFSAIAYYQRDRDFPVLADFRKPSSMYFAQALGDARIKIDELPQSLLATGQPTAGLHVEVTGRKWWGVLLREPLPDWQRYGSLAISVANPLPEPLQIELRLHQQRVDGATGSAFLARIYVPGQSSRTSTVPLSSMVPAGSGPPLDTARVRSLMLARSNPGGSLEFYLLKIWLE